MTFCTAKFHLRRRKSDFSQLILGFRVLLRPEFICRSKGSTVQRAAMKQVFTFLSAAQTLVGRPGWARTLASFHRISSLNGIRHGDSEDIFQIISIFSIYISIYISHDFTNYKFFFSLRRMPQRTPRLLRLESSESSDSEPPKGWRQRPKSSLPPRQPRWRSPEAPSRPRTPRPKVFERLYDDAVVKRQATEKSFQEETNGKKKMSFILI